MRGRLRNAGTGRLTVTVAATHGERFAKAPKEPYRDARTEVLLDPAGEADFAIDADFDPDALVVDPDVMILQVGRKGATARL